MLAGLLLDHLEVTLRGGSDVVRSNTPWMTWNLLLAAVPLGLAFGLFRPGVSRTAAWWLGVGAFIAFLPNAPYVLSDAIHFAGDVRTTRSDSVVLFALMPQYALFMIAGLAMYVAALMRVRNWLEAEGLGRWAWPTELGLHWLCAVGIYVGRVLRFNSWDLVTQPDALARTVGDGLTRRFPLLVIGMTFLFLVAVAPAVRWLVTLVHEGWLARGRAHRPPGLA